MGRTPQRVSMRARKNAYELGPTDDSTRRASLRASLRAGLGQRDCEALEFLLSMNPPPSPQSGQRCAPRSPLHHEAMADSSEISPPAPKHSTAITTTSLCLEQTSSSSETRRVRISLRVRVSVRCRISLWSESVPSHHDDGRGRAPLLLLARPQLSPARCARNRGGTARFFTIGFFK